MALYAILGIISFFIIYMSSWGFGDLTPSWNKSWYENIAIFIVLLLGYSFIFCVFLALSPILVPILIIGYFLEKKEKEIEKQKLADDKAKFEAWKKLPR